ncbi:MAG: DUF934 domain-containing protein [Marinobacterium sp.]|nr:DUF934 domain-containing protein [Marinobacterium sp.]
MPLLINQQLIENDPWQLLTDDEQALPSDGAVILPLARFEQARADGSILQLAPLVSGDDDINALLEQADALALVAIEIPAFTDGRGFSFARILRRAGFKGQIRAIGDVTRDRLAFLTRCGFDAFQIADDRYSDDILSALAEISVNYQGSADEPRPIYNR